MKLLRSWIVRVSAMLDELAWQWIIASARRQIAHQARHPSARGGTLVPVGGIGADDASPRA